jgi:hypothetical protein
LATGCSARGWYQGAQHSQELQCHGLSVGQQQECIEQSRGPDYDRYREALENARQPE